MEASYAPMEEFLKGHLGPKAGNAGKPLPEPQDVVLYGFGRIGRLVARQLIAQSGSGDVLRLRAIVLRKKGANDLTKRADLLRRDSVHGSFNGAILVDPDKDQLICNGNRIQIIYANSPAEVDYSNYGIRDAIVVDNTGVWRDQKGLSQHTNCPGAEKVILTAPGRDNIPCLLYTSPSPRDLSTSRMPSSA